MSAANLSSLTDEQIEALTHRVEKELRQRNKKRQAKALAEALRVGSAQVAICASLVMLSASSSVVLLPQHKRLPAGPT